jgi:hypothetical protein
MTAMTKANQIAQVISLLRNVEIGKAHDVVNIELLAIFGLSYPTLLASVIISRPRPATLTLPVGSIVALIIATAPIVMVLPSVPLIGTLIRAKAKTSGTLVRRRNYHLLATLLATIFVSRLNRGSRHHKTALPSLHITSPRTHRNKPRLNLKRPALKYRRTNLTRISDATLHHLAPEFIGTFTAARSLATMLQSPRVCKISFPTIRAGSLNHVHIIP